MKNAMGDIFESGQDPFDPTRTATDPFTDPLSVLEDPFAAGGLPNPGQAKDLLGKGGDSGAAAAAAANAASVREIAELRRQFDITQGNIDPFLQAGLASLGAQEQGTTAGGLDQRLASIFGTDTFDALVQDRTRDVQGQLAAAGQTRSGAGVEAAAAVPQDIGLQLESLLSARTSELTGSGLNAALGLGGLGANASTAIGQSLAQQGQNTASGLLLDQQQQAAAQQNLINTGAAAATIFFSDPRLKENVEQISQIVDLKVCQWDWIPEVKGSIVDACQTIGFMADEVEEKYPHHVSEFAGFKVIDYPALLDELEVKNANIS